METPANLRYTKEHEWSRIEADRVTVGITDYAQEQLGDVVFVELPDVGSQVEHDRRFGVIESVKAVSDLFSPISGEVIEVNQALINNPEIVNSEPYKDGWMIVVKMSNPKEVDKLLTADQYKALVEQSKSE